MANVEKFVLDRIEQFTREVPKLALCLRGIVADEVADQLAEMPADEVPVELRGWNPTPDENFANVEISRRGNTEQMRARELRAGRGAMAFGYDYDANTVLIHPHSLADRTRFLYDNLGDEDRHRFCGGESSEDVALAKITDNAIADYVIRGMLMNQIPVSAIRIREQNSDRIDNLFRDIRTGKI